MENNTKNGLTPQADKVAQIDIMLSNVMGLCQELIDESSPSTFFGFCCTTCGEDTRIRRLYVGEGSDMDCIAETIGGNLIENPEVPQKKMILKILNHMIEKDPTVVFNLVSEYFDSKSKDKNFGGLFLSATTPLNRAIGDMLVGVGSSRAIIEAILILCANDRGFFVDLESGLNHIKQSRDKFSVEVLDE